MLTWEPVAKYALTGALRAHRELALERDADWVNLALAYLRVRVIIDSEVEADTDDLKGVIDGLAICEVAQTGEWYGSRTEADLTKWSTTRRSASDRSARYPLLEKK